MHTLPRLTHNLDGKRNDGPCDQMGLECGKLS
jgi:hypothetical protein